MGNVENRATWLPEPMAGPKTKEEIKAANVAFSGLERVRFPVDDDVSYDNSLTVSLKIAGDEGTADVTAREYDAMWVDGGPWEELTIRPEGADPVRYHSGFGDGPVQTASVNGRVSAETVKFRIGVDEVTVLQQALTSPSILAPSQDLNS